MHLTLQDATFFHTSSPITENEFGHTAQWVRTISGHRDCGILTISLHVGYSHRRFLWFLASHRHKKGVSQPNGYVTSGAAAGECEVIQELLAEVTSSAEPEEQNDFANAWIRLQCLGPLVHQAQKVCCCACMLTGEEAANYWG